MQQRSVFVYPFFKLVLRHRTPSIFFAVEFEKQNNNKEQKPNAAAVKSGAISYSPPDPFTGKDPVQLMVVASEHKKNKDINVALEFEQSLDDSVTRSYNHVITAPGLGFKSNNGYITKWQTDWNAYVSSGKRDLLAASFGYAVEALTNDVYRPKAPTGYTEKTQETRGNTRPDYILQEGNRDVSWLDITASNSTGHIWGKGPPYWSEQPHASEVAYPSIDDATLLVMKNNNANTTPSGFNREAYLEQMKKAYELAQKRANHWREKGGLISDGWSTAPGKDKASGKTSPMLFLQSPVMILISRIFKPQFANKIITYNENYCYNDSRLSLNETDEIAEFRQEAPHILAALGLNPKTYGFNGGSVNRGKAWLLVNDPKLPQAPGLSGDKNNNVNDNTNNNANNNNASASMTLDSKSDNNADDVQDDNKMDVQGGDVTVSNNNADNNINDDTNDNDDDNQNMTGDIEID